MINFAPLKIKTFILFLSFCYNMYGHGASSCVASYYIDTTQKVDFEHLDDLHFVVLPEHKLCGGLEVNQCWVRVQIDNTTRVQDYIFELRGLYATLEAIGLRSDKDTTLLCDAGCDNYKLCTLRKTNSAIKLRLAKGTHNVYFKLSFSKEATLSVNAYKESEYEFEKAYAALDVGLYYGIALTVLIINLLCFFYFKDTLFIQYMATLLIINLTVACYDGILQWVLPEGWLTDNALILLLCLLCYIGAYVFASNYLQLRRYIPQSLLYAKVLIIVTMVCFGLFFVSQNFIYYTIGHIFVFLILCFYLSLGFILYKKHISARYFAIGYTLLFFSGILYVFSVLLPHLGQGLPLKYVKLGGFIEMVVLFMGILARFSALKKENEEMRTQICEYLNEIQKSEASSKDAAQKEQGVLKTIIETFDLSDREQEVLFQLSQGQSNNKIAENLFISINTVKYHTRNIYAKLNVRNRMEAVNKYYRQAEKH